MLLNNLGDSKSNFADHALKSSGCSSEKAIDAHHRTGACRHLFDLCIRKYTKMY